MIQRYTVPGTYSVTGVTRHTRDSKWSKLAWFCILPIPETDAFNQRFFNIENSKLIIGRLLFESKKSTLTSAPNASKSRWGYLEIRNRRTYAAISALFSKEQFAISLNSYFRVLSSLQHNIIESSSRRDTSNHERHFETHWSMGGSTGHSGKLTKNTMRLKSRDQRSVNG